MSNCDLLELSDGIDDMRRQFRHSAHGGCRLTSDDITGLLDHLDGLHRRALKLETRSRGGAGTTQPAPRPTTRKRCFRRCKPPTAMCACFRSCRARFTMGVWPDDTR